jgi:hypothetical protein
VIILSLENTIKRNLTMAQRPLHDKPTGTESYDKDALSDKQQEKLNAKKIELRMDNERYLRQHPELSLLVQHFLREVFLKKPNNIREFAAKFFTDPALSEQLEQLLKTNDRQFEINKIIQKVDLNKLTSD